MCCGIVSPLMRQLNPTPLKPEIAAYNVKAKEIPRHHDKSEAFSPPALDVEPLIPDLGLPAEEPEPDFPRAPRSPKACGHGCHSGMLLRGIFCFCVFASFEGCEFQNTGFYLEVQATSSKYCHLLRIIISRRNQEK